MENSPIKWVLAIASYIADLFTVAVILAPIVKQNALLIFFILVAAIGLFAAFYLLRQKIQYWMVFVGSMLFAALAVLLLVNYDVTPLQVSITDPRDGANVTTPCLIEGTVSDPKAKVYVFVRAQRESEMVVQQLPIVDGEGKWQGSVHLAIDVGELYEVIALAVNDNSLVTCVTGNVFSEGQKLTSLPTKSNKSNLVTVTRRFSTDEAMKAAFDEFNRLEYDQAITKANDCIEKFKSGADSLQASLETEQRPMYPTGTIVGSQRQEVFDNGMLNAVAGCYWIKARSYHAKGNLEQAKETYLITTQYTYARIYDPAGDFFWSPADDAGQRVKQIP